MSLRPMIRHLCVCILILLISVYLGIELGLSNEWGEIKSFRKLWLLMGAVISSFGMILITLRTYEKKDYVNLLWLALPVLTLMSIEEFFKHPPFRVFLIMFLISACLLTFWFAFQKRGFSFLQKIFQRLPLRKLKACLSI